MLAATKAGAKLTPYDGSGSFRVYLLDQLYQFGTAGPAWDKPIGKEYSTMRKILT